MVKLNIDCLMLIFNHLSSKNSLYSCLLVNRDWCHLVVPILWKYPWYNEPESKRKLFNKDINKFQKIVKRNLLEQELYKLFIHQCKNFGDFLFWENVQPLSVFPGAKTCFAKLNHLTIDLNFVTSTALYGMAQICKNIEY